MKTEKNKNSLKDEILIPIKDLVLSQRLRNVLELNNIEFLNSLKNKTSREIRKWRSLGHQSFRELEKNMSDHGLCFLDCVTAKNITNKAIYENFINLDRRLENMEDSLRMFRIQISQTLAMFKDDDI